MDTRIFFFIFHSDDVVRELIQYVKEGRLFVFGRGDGID